MSEIAGLYTQRPIIHRHKNAALYHPFIEALALTLVDVPITFLTSIVFGVILYFMVGLQRSAVSGPQLIILLYLIHNEQSQFLFVTTAIIKDVLY
jgi:ATP-binding cassette subfamily G (WHITE) protein 2 (SNQ2)